MLTKLHYTVSGELLQEALNSMPNIEFREAINQPTGNFFYDPWEIKPEFKNTAWEKILNTLPREIGEARIIILKGGACYQSHADIDDRYHLNIAGDRSYLINLDTLEMFPQTDQGEWYEMDAGPRHSAVNFGYVDRVQLVIRKLLNNSKLANPVSIKMYYAGDDKDTARFVFDDVLSPWLSRANKSGIMANFSYSHNLVQLDLEQDHVVELESLIPEHFILKKND